MAFMGDDDPARTGLDRIALTAASGDELQKWASWLDFQNVPRSAVRDVLDYGAMFNFADPDGLQLEFIFMDQSKRQQSTALA